MSVQYFNIFYARMHVFRLSKEFFIFFYFIFYIRVRVIKAQA